MSQGRSTKDSDCFMHIVRYSKCGSFSPEVQERRRRQGGRNARDPLSLAMGQQAPLPIEDEILLWRRIPYSFKKTNKKQ